MAGELKYADLAANRTGVIGALIRLCGRSFESVGEVSSGIVEAIGAMAVAPE